MCPLEFLANLLITFPEFFQFFGSRRRANPYLINEPSERGDEGRAAYDEHGDVRVSLEDAPLLLDWSGPKNGMPKTRVEVALPGTWNLEAALSLLRLSQDGFAFATNVIYTPLCRFFSLANRRRSASDGPASRSGGPQPRGIRTLLISVGNPLPRLGNGI